MIAIRQDTFHRMYLLLFLFTLIFALRLVHLQIIRSDEFHQRGSKNFLRTEYTPSLRGNIRDCTGTLLATNIPDTSLCWKGTGNRTLSAEQEWVINYLCSTLEKEHDDMRNIISIAERSHRITLLSSSLSFDQLCKIQETIACCKNILIKTTYKRYYPYNSYACHLLGALGNPSDPSGQMGLEKMYDQLLSGTKGLVTRTINSFGQTIELSAIEKELDGQDIYITIDINLQELCEKVFPQGYSGAAILMDPQDGALKAVVSRPEFDPALFLSRVSSDRWQSMQKENTFLNRAFNACYPPGSIFKLVSLSAAFEHGIAAKDDVWECKGFIKYGNQTIWCNKHYGHGILSTTQAVAQSCNILFYEIGKKLDIDELANYSYRFGLGRPTETILPERIGLIPTREWKEKTKHERWWPGETLSVSIGQSFLLTTPLQIARMMSAIYTGYLVKPRIVMSERLQYEPLDISHDTREFLKSSMRAVIKMGTGKRIKTVTDIEIFAKTSTAQTSSLKKRNQGKEHLEHGWFAGVFQYKNNKPLTVVILIEHAGTAQKATLTAKNLLIEYKKLMNYQE